MCNSHESKIVLASPPDEYVVNNYKINIIKRDF